MFITSLPGELQYLSSTYLFAKDDEEEKAASVGWAEEKLFGEPCIGRTKKNADFWGVDI